MEHALADTQENIEYVEVVAKISEILPGSNSQHLKEFIANLVTDTNEERKSVPVLLMFSDVSWINIQGSHQYFHSIIKQGVVAINIGNINCEDDDLRHVEEESVHVMSSSICIPFELDQWLQCFAFEDIKFICAGDHLHPWNIIVEKLFGKGAISSFDQCNMCSNLWQDVDGVLDFVNFAGVDILFGAAIFVEEVIEFRLWENCAVMLSNTEY